MTLQKTFIVWLTSLVVVMAVIVIALISGREASKLTQQLERERQQLGGEIVALLTLTDNLMQAQVKSSMRLLNQRIAQSGAVSVGQPVEVAGRRVNDLVFNGTGQANRFELVDAVTDIMGGTATLFSRDNNDFVRISTNVITNNNRAIGTVLDPNGLAIAAIRRGTAFYGVVDILGNPFVTGYEPVTDSSNNVIGISYVGYRADLEALNRIVMQSRLLSQGFVAIEDRSGKVRVNSDNIAADAVQQILAGQNDGWQQQTLEFAPWGYKVHLVYSETERNSLVWQTLRSLIALVVVFGILLIAMVFFLTRYVVIQPLNKVNASLANIVEGEGDLTARLNFNRKDEIGTMASGFDALLDRVRRTIVDVQQVSGGLKHSAVTMDHAAKQVLQKITQQTHDTAAIANAIEEMTTTSHAVATGALDAETAAQEVATRAEQVMTVIENTVTNSQQQMRAMAESEQAINSLTKASQDIAKVLEVINSIAEQTNLLALNAAIEAARAGEQGRGFSVVADEVRSLAGRTQASTGEIKQMISGLESGVASVEQINSRYKLTVADNVKFAEGARNALHAVQSAVDQIKSQNAGIASAAEQQSTVAENINQKTRQIRQLAQDSAQQSEIAQQTSTALMQQCETLVTILSQYRV
ncbi:Methyl-accepting chemotaxis protein [Rheinheimera pacifica]|uniref:Methyl-accepting chemotaxis protein n=1 Tax=Rheinheimera pacifica TaxID=173990 RepID=A0A1H6M882_9GAMM|nr:Cache 3/Cache 2 fusion domain-containing protein [Rheinheimera pacifica]SEH94233.1 Methyl-accepting chemotaxis protein [Rheinheimera pacifica]